MRDRFGGWNCLVALIVAAATGCACPGTYYYGSHGCGVRSLSGRNGDGAATCDGSCGACDTCDGNVGSCDSCGPSGPCRLRDVIGCNSGCGRMYWGEWAYDPPDACDPCDDCGNWAGPQNCPPRGIWCLLGFLQGHRSCASCGTVGCESCETSATSGCGCGDGAVSETPSEEIWSDSSEFLLEPSSEPAEPRDAPVQGESVLRESRRVQPSKPMLGKQTSSKTTSSRPASSKQTSKQTSSRVVRRGRAPDMH